MKDDDPVLLVIDALNAFEVPFMLVGSYSSNLYTIPRATVDADFVVELADRPIGPIAQRLVPHFKLDSQMSFETVTFHHRWKLEHVESDFSVELFLLVGDEFDQQRFRRRIRNDVCGRPAWFQTAEDVVVNKLRWARRKDRFDVEEVIKMNGATLNWPYIEHWCRVFGRIPLLQQLKANVENE